MDFEEELLGLMGEGAGASSKADPTASSASKRGKSARTGRSKRKRAATESDEGSASDMDMSQSDSDGGPPPASSAAARADSDEDDSDDDSNKKKKREKRKSSRSKASEENPYPVEGIYKDSAERYQVAQLPELEREEFIATRMEEINERATRAEVAKLARQSGARHGGARDEDDDEDEEEEEDDDEYGARETRSRKVTGASKTKSEGLEKLKKSRAEKGKKREKADSSDDDYEEVGRKKGRKASPSASASSDMDVSDSDQDTRGRGSAVRKQGSGGKKAGPEPLAPQELREITLTRTKLAEMCRAPWFDHWVVDAFVRITVGLLRRDDPAAGNKYRVARVTGVKPAKQPYRIEGTMTEHELELTIGKDRAVFGMMAVSNSPVTDHEYSAYVRLSLANGTNPMTSKEAAKVKAQLSKHTGYTLTEEDLQKQLEASGAALRGPGAKTRLKIQRDHALAAGDAEKVRELNEKLAALDAPATGAEQDRARLINERNRANNREEIRRAEAKSQEQRRKQAELLARGDTEVRIDPSARVKTMPRLNYDNSRPQTPGPGSGAATPTKNPLAAAAAAAAVAAAEAPRQRGSKIEVASQVAINVDDLLDFCAS